MVNLVVGFERSGKTRKFQKMIKKDLKRKKKIRVVCLHNDLEGYKKLCRRAKIVEINKHPSCKNVLKLLEDAPYVVVSLPSNVSSELSLNSEKDFSFTFGQSEVMTMLSQEVDSLYIDDAQVVLRNNVVKSRDGIHGISGLLNNINFANAYKTDVHLACQVLSSLSNE